MHRATPNAMWMCVPKHQIFFIKVSHKQNTSPTENEKKMEKMDVHIENGSRQKITQIITHPYETAHKSGSHKKNKPEELASYNSTFYCSFVLCLSFFLICARIHSFIP